MHTAIVAFHRFKDMNLEHIFGLTNIHTFEPNIRLIRLFSPILNYYTTQLPHKIPTLSPVSQEPRMPCLEASVGFFDYGQQLLAQLLALDISGGGRMGSCFVQHAVQNITH